MVTLATAVTDGPWQRTTTRPTIYDSDTDLARRQREHLDEVARNTGVGAPRASCLHMQCTECVGTGVRKDGHPCVHALSCPCPRCTFR